MNGAPGGITAAIGRLRLRLADHPRHVLLAVLVAGLLAGPRWPPALLAVAALAPVVARDGRVALGAVAALLAGAAIADARLATLERTALGPSLGRAVSVHATLLEPPRERSFRTRVAAVRLRAGPAAGERVLVRTGARVTWPRDVQPGAELAVSGRLTALAPYESFERRRGAHATLRAESIRATGRSREGPLGALDGVRRRTELALTTGVPAAQGALARGMVLGQDDALTEEVREHFRATGLAHLVAASGANVMLLATLVLALGAAAGLGLTGRLLLAIALVVAYVPLAGAGPSIQRAGVMGVAGLVAALAGRPSSRAYALLLAAALTLAWDPRSAEDPGWQMSFAAVVALLALVRPLSERLIRARVPRALADALALTIAATVGTAPLIALHFERISLVSLPANVLAAPAVAPIMWLGTLAGGLGQVAPGLATPLAQLAALPLGYLTWLAERAAGLSWAESTVPSPGVAGVVGAYAILALAVLGWRRLPAGRSRRAVVAALVVAAAVAVVFVGRPPEPPDHLVVSFLDVGQGDATLVQHGSAAVLVDTGPPGGPIIRRLADAGVRRLDLLVVTHDAADHGGATEEVLRELPVGLVLDGEEPGGAAPHDPRSAPVPAVRAVASARRVRRLPSDAGQALRAGPLELGVLWPDRDDPAGPDADPNQRATVVHLRDGEFDLLLTADAESDVLGLLELVPVEALKVAHHGSEDPGLPALLERLRPQVATVSAGRNNSYGHPHPDTTNALRAVPLVRRTDHDGTIRLHVRDGRMSVETER